MNKLNRHRSGSIRNQMIWTFGLLLCVETVVFGLLSNYLYQRTLVQTNEAYMSQFVSQLRLVTDNYVSYLVDISEVVTENPEIKSYLADEDILEPSLDVISMYLESVKTTRSDIGSIILISPTGAYLSDSRLDNFYIHGAPVDEKWRQYFIDHPDREVYLTASHVQNLIDAEYPWVISLYRRSGDGYIVVDLNYSVIEELCSGIDIGGKGYVFIFNEHGEMVYHPRLDLIYNDLKSEMTTELIGLSSGSLQTTVDSQDVLYTFESSDLTGWTLVSVGYTEQLFTSLRELQFYLWLVLVITLSVAVFISLFLSMQITRPIEILRSLMKEVEKGNYDIDIDVDCDNEVYDLAIDCDIAIKKIKDLIVENERDQETKRKHELKALQAQINPHFLYNTLDSIIWLTEAGSNDDAISLTEQLATFFRLSLSRGEEIIPIEFVYQHLEAYLTIQKMRYKNTLDFRIDFDPKIMSYTTPKLLLQPIVENSIYHGLKNLKGIGHITISACRKDDSIEFCIEDDGVGMSDELIGRVNTGDYSHFSRSGVGIRNVAERIDLSFGDEFGIHFTHRNGGGTVATITVPALVS